MRILAFAALVVAAAPVFAADGPTAASAGVTARAGQMLRDSSNLRIGAVDTVKSDGSVGVIVDGRYFIVPAGTLTMADGKLTTSLSKKALTSQN